MARIRPRKIPPVAQAQMLKAMIPDSSFTLKDGGAGVVWTGCIQPNAISLRYWLSVSYRLDIRPVIRVLSPALVIPEGQELPHVYSHERRELCLYYPPAREWHGGLLFTKTILPWASEWLYHYETWAATGQWHGGGIEHGSAREKKNFADTVKNLKY